MGSKYKPGDFVYAIYNNEVVYARIYIVRCYLCNNVLTYDYLLEIGNSNFYIPESLVFSDKYSLFEYWGLNFLTFRYD